MIPTCNDLYRFLLSKIQCEIYRQELITNMSDSYLYSSPGYQIDFVKHVESCMKKNEFVKNYLGGGTTINACMGVVMLTVALIYSKSKSSVLCTPADTCRDH